MVTADPPQVDIEIPDGLRLIETETVGRALEATVPFRIGDIVMRERPLVEWQSTNMQQSIALVKEIQSAVGTELLDDLMLSTLLAFIQAPISHHARFRGLIHISGS